MGNVNVRAREVMVGVETKNTVLRKQIKELLSKVLQHFIS